MIKYFGNSNNDQSQISPQIDFLFMKDFVIPQITVQNNYKKRKELLWSTTNIAIWQQQISYGSNSKSSKIKKFVLPLLRVVFYNRSFLHYA